MLKTDVAAFLIAQIGITSLLLAGPPDKTDAAQQSGTPTFRTNVRQVLVPVVVTDQKGHRVADLKASDFNVLEDGVPQDLVAVSSSSDPAFASLLHAAPALPDPASPLPQIPQAPHQDSAGVQRTYLLCIDTLHSAFGNFGAVRDAIAKVLAHENGQGLQYALVTLGREVKIQQQPTSDASQLVAAARSKEFANAIQDSETTTMSALLRQFRDLMQGYCTNCACKATGKNRDGPSCGIYRGQVQGAVVSFGERESVLTHNFLVQLHQLVKATAALPGARTIVLISDGFNRFPGRELSAIIQAYGPTDPNLPRFNPRDTRSEMESVLRVATEYNIAFYTLDSRGVYASASTAGTAQDASASFSSPTLNDGTSAPPQSLAVASLASDRELMAVARENTDGMAMLARATGGLFFENNNDLAKGIRTALEDGQQYYLLAYVSKNQTPDGQYRKIEVEVIRGKKRRLYAERVCDEEFWIRDR